MAIGLIRVSELPVLTDEEIKKRTERRKKEYNEMLNSLTNDEKIKGAARELSDFGACDGNICVFYGDEGTCWCPYTDGYINDLEINVCYEGILKKLSNDVT